METQIKIPHKNQIKILEDTHRFRVACCGRRFGKTACAIEEMFSLAFLREDQNIAYIAPTYKLTKEIAWEELLKRCRDVILEKNETNLTLQIKTKSGGKSKISLKSWEAVEDFLGQKFDFIVLDEVSKYNNFRYGWLEIISPTLIDRKGQALFISTPNGLNHFYDLYLNELKYNDWKSFNFNTYDNPFIPLEEIERLKNELPADVFAQECLAEFRQKAGLVYSEFKRDKHIIEEIPAGEVIIQKIAGVDFGFSVPSAIVYIGISQRRNFYIMNEYYEKNKINTDLIVELSKERLEYVYPDPAEPDRIEEMRRAGIPVKPVNKDIEKGIDTIKTFLKTDRLFILKHCINFITEIENYSWKEHTTRDGEYTDKPIDDFNHLLDATRYALYNFSPLSTRNNFSTERQNIFISKYSKGKNML